MTARSRLRIPGDARHGLRDHIGVRRALVLAVVATILGALGVLLLAPATDTPAAAAEPCHWRTEYDRTIRELGDDPAQWRISTDPPVDYRGFVWPDTGVATVVRGIECELVADVVRHEWMHRQQWRMYGEDFGGDVLGGNRVELVADCGSQLLGSTATPFVRDAEAERGFGCSPLDLAQARELIGYR